MIGARTFREYVLNVAVGVDQLGNSLFGGDPHETISSRAWLAKQQGKRWGCVLCRWLEWFQKDHCRIAAAAEIAADQARIAADERD